MSERDYLLGVPSTSKEEWKKKDFTITWRDLCVSVKIRNRNFFGRNPQPYKRLINNVSGVVKAGSLVVLMGPSGAGKSTLMGALAHRNASNVFVEGEVRVNGELLGSYMHYISGFVHQEDLFMGTLTVTEHLLFMARLKLDRGKTGSEIRQIVKKLIMEMGLLQCANTKIGKLGEEKGISGGEKKRLAFATEILTDPPILFCDEPTTGLDSFSAKQILNLMKQMTYEGKTVLCTIHQPSSELFAMFEQLILLTEGRIAFTGDSKSALDFFEQHGFACPEHYNPAEVLIRALSTSSKDKSKNLTVIRRLCDEFAVSPTAREFDDIITKAIEEKAETQDYIKMLRLKVNRRSPSWITKIFWLTYRSFLQVLRDPSVQSVRILQKLAIALMAGLCFFGNVNLTQAGVQSVQGAVFVLVTENTFPPMYGVLSLFPDEFPLFLREYKSGFYSTHLYYVSKMISLLPGLIVEPVLFVLIAYLVSGLRQTLYAFLMTIAIAILTTNVAGACGCFFSSAFESVSMALAFLVPIDYILMVTSGLFIKLSSIPAIIAWFQYLSWFMYSFEALSIVQWKNVENITCEYENVEIPCLKNGEEVLQKFDFKDTHLYDDLIAMGLMYCIFHVLGYFFIWWKTNRNS